MTSIVLVRSMYIALQVGYEHRGLKFGLNTVSRTLNICVAIFGVHATHAQTCQNRLKSPLFDQLSIVTPFRRTVNRLNESFPKGQMLLTDVTWKFEGQKISRLS